MAQLALFLAPNGTDPDRAVQQTLERLACNGSTIAGWTCHDSTFCWPPCPAIISRQHTIQAWTTPGWCVAVSAG